ncbi:hypothetical protein [Streptomyces sp. NPDC056255]|uniref:hypothetical protein n=1 Tax=Streptomyces sp. NPDC056255 TaxID=3345764 RepID=UPI0035E1AC49
MSAAGVRISYAWAAGELDDDAFEGDFIDYVIIEGIGDGIDGSDFLGSSYTVTAQASCLRGEGG